MPNIDAISKDIITIFSQSSGSAFDPNSNADILYMGMNNARRWAERAHDFYYTQIDCFLSIGANGSSYASAYIDTTATATGTLSPNVAGSFALTGTYNSLPFYTKTVASVVYFLAYSGTAWNITAGGFTLGSDYWNLTTASTSPIGVYTAHGANTGALTITQATGTIALKKIANVMLPVAGGYYVPIEFLTNDEWNERMMRLIGRPHYNALKNIEEIGLGQFNAAAVQQAQTLFLQPSAQFTFPVVAKLSATRWMPDYTTGADTDFFTERAPDFITWRACVEINNWMKYFAEKQEGNINEKFISDMADTAFQSLLAWDMGIQSGTSTQGITSTVAPMTMPPGSK